MSSDLANQDEVRKEAEVAGVKVQSGQPFNYDDILLLIGEVRKFQLRSILFLCLPAFFPGIVILSYRFVGAVPDYRYQRSLNIEFDELSRKTPRHLISLFRCVSFVDNLYIVSEHWGNLHDDCYRCI